MLGNDIQAGPVEVPSGATAAFCVVALMVTFLCGCTVADVPTNVPPDGDDGGPPADALGSSFLYLLQPENVALDDITGQPFRWIVIEPSRTGDANGEFSAVEIEQVRSVGACSQRVVLAYLSIGEAEDYRDYFEADWVAGDAGSPIDGVAPDWLGESNPDFPGNYKVRYWDEGWQSLILGEPEGADATPLDRIINAGYDGVYLDIIDGYEYWSGEQAGNELSRQEARERMIAWVQRIADYARQTRGVSGFLVFPQNASEIISDDDDEIDTLGEAYLDAIDGIGIEDLFYDEISPQSEESTQRRLAQLAEYRSRDKTVLVTDYVLDAALSPAMSGVRANDFYQRAIGAGFMPYAATSDRDLDEILILNSADWEIEQPAPCSE